MNAAELGLPTCVVFLVFLVKTWRGRNRARITMTVLVTTALLQVAVPPDHVAESSLLVLWIAVGVVTAASAAFGLVLLWQPPAGTWFRAMGAYRAEWGHWSKR